MTRGKRAPLSPHEEVTLRRIALGITQAPHLSKSDIKRLKALSLIEENGGDLGLTPMGSDRYLSLAKSAAVDPSHSSRVRAWHPPQMRRCCSRRSFSRSRRLDHTGGAAL